MDHLPTHFLLFFHHAPFFEVTKDSPWFPQVKGLYESAFPANERIPIKQLMDNKIQREFFAFVDDINGSPTFCGFSNSITRGTITNIVYFAVEPKLRSRGYGSQILKTIHELHPDTRLVVDIEVEEDSKDAKELEFRERRRNFYLRNGFEASPFDYIWRNEHFRLLSAGGTVTEQEFRDFWKEVLKNIPGAKYP